MRTFSKSMLLVGTFYLLASCGQSQFSGKNASVKEDEASSDSTVEQREYEGNVANTDVVSTDDDNGIVIDQGFLDGPGIITKSFAVNFELNPNGDSDNDYNDVTVCFQADEEAIRVDGNKIIVGKDITINIKEAFNSAGNKVVEVKSGGRMIHRRTAPSKPYYTTGNFAGSFKKVEEVVVMASYGSPYYSNTTTRQARVSAVCNN